jgi:hypothetical protein
MDVNFDRGALGMCEVARAAEAPAFTRDYWALDFLPIWGGVGYCQLVITERMLCSVLAER